VSFESIITKPSVIAGEKFVSNGYPSSFVQKITKAWTTPRREPVTEFKSTAVLPYVQGVSESLHRCLEPQGIRTVFKSDTTLWSHLVQPKDTMIIIIIIVSMTKFSIMIGSLHAYLPRNRHAITWVSNYRYPIWTFCNLDTCDWIPMWFAPQLCTLKWLSLQCFLQFSKLMKRVTYVFAQKKFTKDTFNSKICYRLD